MSQQKKSCPTMKPDTLLLFFILLFSTCMPFPPVTLHTQKRRRARERENRFEHIWLLFTYMRDPCIKKSITEKGFHAVSVKTIHVTR